MDLKTIDLPSTSIHLRIWEIDSFIQMRAQVFNMDPKTQIYHPFKDLGYGFLHLDESPTWLGYMTSHLNLETLAYIYDFPFKP